MKSAYERALAKFGGISELDDAKKARIAEIDRKYTSQIVGTELGYYDKIQVAGSEDEREGLRHRMRAEIEGLKELAEKEKEQVRGE